MTTRPAIADDLRALGAPPEAIRAATATAAETPARGDRTNALEPGKPGGALLVEGDPASGVGVPRDGAGIVRIPKAGEAQPRREREVGGRSFSVMAALAREGVGAVTGQG